MFNKNRSNSRGKAGLVVYILLSLLALVVVFYSKSTMVHNGIVSPVSSTEEEFETDDGDLYIENYIETNDDGYVINAEPVIGEDDLVYFIVNIKDENGKYLSEEETKEYLEKYPRILNAIRSEQKRYNNLIRSKVKNQINKQNLDSESEPEETYEEMKSRIEAEEAEKYKKKLEDLKKELLEKERRRVRPERKKTNDSRDIFFG